MITLPANFKSDIQGQNLNLYPVVIFETSPDAEGDIMVSTKDVTLGVRHFKPLLLNIPSVKESMDFENRNYKISNVTLQVSNYEYEGERFSDYAGNLINVAVKIYWISQSYPSDHTIGFTNAGDEFALQVYKGFIRRYSHDSKTVTLKIEDASQKDLHKDVPVARLGDGDEILSKYRNQVIPMVYGHVDKSPCVVKGTIEEEEEEGGFQILADYSNTIVYLDGNIVNDNVKPASLWIFEEESWLNVPQEKLTSFDFYEDLGITDNFQYEINLNIIFVKAFESKNLISFDMIQVVNVPEVSCKKIWSGHVNDPVVVTNSENIYDFDFSTYASGEGTIGLESFTVPNVGTVIVERGLLIENTLNIPFESSSPIKVAPILKFDIESQETNTNIVEAKIGFDVDRFYQSSGGSLGSNEDGNIISFIEESIGSGIPLSEHNIPFDTSPQIFEEFDDFIDIPPLIFKIGYNYDLFEDFGFMEISTNIYEVSVALIFDIEKLSSRNFFVNVNGRTLIAYE